MFYDGDLQSGISQALAESKLVACFVRGGLESLISQKGSRSYCDLDDSDQSTLWENDFLRDNEVFVHRRSGKVPLQFLS